jgi:hypothetical protein
MRAPLKLASHSLQGAFWPAPLALFLLLKFGFVLPICCPKLLSVSAERVPQHSSWLAAPTGLLVVNAALPIQDIARLSPALNGPINYDGIN